MSNTDSTTVLLAGPHRRALRLTLAYEGDRIEVLAEQRVQMIVPPSDSLDLGGVAEFWADLKDVQGRTLFRRIMGNPIRRDVEAFSDAPEQNISRVRAVPKGVFVVLLPDVEQGHHVTLHTLCQEANSPVVREIACFTLHR